MSDKNEIVTKFGFTKAELIEYRTLMQIPDIDQSAEQACPSTQVYKLVEQLLAYCKLELMGKTIRRTSY